MKTTSGNNEVISLERKPMRITLAQASAIVDAALARARKGAFHPMTVAVIDAGGHLVAFKREDRAGIRPARHSVAHRAPFMVDYSS